MTTNCSQCQIDFTIDEADLAFYKKISPNFHGQIQAIPAPTLCPACRQKRRLATRNDSHLYNRKCSKCNKDIVSIYTANKKYPVYCSSCWWQDTWDPMNYGFEFDFQGSVFEQFKKLQRVVPRLALINRDAENSEYTHYTAHNKNCYLVFNADDNQDCYYCHSIDSSKDCMDMYWSGRSELCYEGISVGASYNSQFCNHCENLSNCYFCYDCKDCHDCYGCVSLEHKNFYIFNQPYSKETYQKKLAAIIEQKKSFLGLEKLKKDVKNFFLTVPHKYATISNCENCTGNYLVNCNNCQDCYYIMRSQDCKYLIEGGGVKDAYDGDFCGLKNSELLYEVHDCWFGYQMLFSMSCWNCHDMYYCDHCFYTNNCFGCIGLRHKEYCIFNKQYTKEEYEAVVPKIIQHMQTFSSSFAANPLPNPAPNLETNHVSNPEANHAPEWGEFFPIKNSLFEISETPISEIIMQERDRSENNTITLHHSQIPNTITLVPGNILEHRLTCERCAKSFRILPQELKFYQAHDLPLPHLCFLCRQKERKAQLPPHKLYARNCDKCKTKISSPYGPERPEVIYCEQCYQTATH